VIGPRTGVFVELHFTVRRISSGEGRGSEGSEPSPRVDKFESEPRSDCAPREMTYLRKRLGKGAVAVREGTKGTSQPASAAPKKARCDRFRGQPKPPRIKQEKSRTAIVCTQIGKRVFVNAENLYGFA